jgi:hypothetical protein
MESQSGQGWSQDMKEADRSKDRAGSEQRRESRTRDAGMLLWRRCAGGTPEMGQVLETSRGGFAFACRGAAPPRENEAIEVRFVGERFAEGPVHAVVKRSDIAHSDLSIVAAQRLNFCEEETSPAKRSPRLSAAAVAVANRPGQLAA